jgi:hypothetical protein
LEKGVGRKGKHVAIKDIYRGTEGEGNFVDSMYTKSLNKSLGENTKMFYNKCYEVYLLLCFERLTAILAVHLVHYTVILRYIRGLKKGNEAIEQLHMFRICRSVDLHTFN